MTYLAANIGDTAMRYRVYDAKACKMRLDIFSVDDESNVYVELAMPWPLRSCRAVKSNRIIIPNGPGTIIINALPDDAPMRRAQGETNDDIARRQVDFAHG